MAFIRCAEEMEAHVLVFPFPLLGHVNCMLKLAELFSLAGLHVTFLNTHHNHRLLARNSGAYARLLRRPTLRFLSITDGFEDDRSRSASRLLDLVASLQTNSASPFKDLLLDLRRDGGVGRPALTCVIADGLMSFLMDVANELGIPAIFFRTVSACSIWSYFCVPNLLQNGELPFPENCNLDEIIRGVPGMEGFLRRRDLSIFLREAKDASDPALQLVSAATADMVKARALIVNTFESLEPSMLSHIRSRCPVTYSIGPLHALLRTYYRLRSPNSCEEDDTQEKGSAIFWEEDRSCIRWLDAQPKRSVVYVSFGSLTVMSKQDFHEFWHGLVNSGQRFLWVVRRDLVNENEQSKEGGSSAVTELMKATRERGCLVEWAPQEEVLEHPAVGCFLTHSGWNSTLESLVAGVPMLCWPFFADQQINSRFVEAVWKVGMDMKDVHDRESMERMVREMMEGRRAEELRRSAAEMAEMARKSVSAEGGSSFVALEKLIKDMRSLSSEQ
ncbi:hypothetical protein Cni_G10720 [Canna indica]|uniref:Glycosyltransferase n=1 Tax=Canna indica TaxID=4628 RepID=A0AAQ3Q7K1_9LILI|nr:hypothetical protein Cni_G10720 [Canna indica]